ncbi:MAG: hypothetical protein IPP17_27495 [Bacteroidetes bacterium]|nr:hypothetical protein [Bacteroidota bacterium]
MGTYVGKWDCPKCGTKRILGWENGQTVVSCPACGGPSTGKWYLDSRDMEISEAGELALAKSKRAWQCGHCDKVNDGSRDTCISCGNPRDKESGDDQFIAREYDPRDVPQTGEEVENPMWSRPLTMRLLRSRGFRRARVRDGIWKPRRNGKGATKS